MVQKTKKTIKKTIIIVLLISVAAVVIFLVYASYIKHQLSTEKTVDPNDIQYYYGMVGCMYLMEKNNIDVDINLKNNVKNDCEKLIEDSNLDNIPLLRLSRLIFIDNYFNLGYNQKLMNEIDKYYDEKNRLFSDYKIGSNVINSELSDEEVIISELNSTSDLCQIFYFTDIDYDSYDIAKLLADFFNNNWQKYDPDEMNIEDRLVLSPSLVSVFYLFLDMDKLDLLNYQTAWDTLKKDHSSDIFEDNKDNNDFAVYSISNISGINDDLKVIKRLNGTFTPKYKTVQEYYNLLDSEDAFEYDKESDTFPLMTFSYLYMVEDIDLSENKYFSDNINTWLKENYQIYIEVKNSEVKNS